MLIMVIMPSPPSHNKWEPIASAQEMFGSIEQGKIASNHGVQKVQIQGNASLSSMESCKFKSFSWGKKLCFKGQLLAPSPRAFCLL